MMKTKEDVEQALERKAKEPHRMQILQEHAHLLSLIGNVEDDATVDLVLIASDNMAHLIK